MATIGYLKEVKNAHILDRNLQLLRRASVSLSSITIGGDIVQLIDSLSCGDCLVVLSTSELSPQIARQQLLLKRIADNGIVFRPLQVTDATLLLRPKNFLHRWFRRLQIVGSRPNHRSGAPTPSETSALKAQIVCDCLKSYYELKENVETICSRAQIQPRTLYNFLHKHNLPSRRQVKAKPKINPLRRPGFPENLLGARSTDETK